MSVPISHLSIVDAHHHLWELARFPYAWLSPEAPPARFGDHTSIKRDYLPHDYRMDFEGFQLQGSVHVQANCGADDPVAETRWLQSLAETGPVPGAVVAQADLGADDSLRLIERHARFPVLRGIRAMVAWDAGGRWRFSDRPGVLLEPAFRRGVQALVDHNLSLDLVVLPGQLPEVADLAAAMPDLRIVINHLGQPEPDQPGNEELWHHGIYMLKPCENIFIKASGLWLIDKDWNPDRLRPFISHVIKTMGAKRVMYGSNLPVEKVNTPVPAQIRALIDCLADRTAEEVNSVFSRTALEFYRI